MKTKTGDYAGLVSGTFNTLRQNAGPEVGAPQAHARMRPPIARVGAGRRCPALTSVAESPKQIDDKADHQNQPKPAPAVGGTAKVKAAAAEQE